MAHNQAMRQAELAGKAAAKAGKGAEANPYHVGRETALCECWAAAHRLAKEVRHG